MGAVLCIDWLLEFFVLAGLVQDGLPVALRESPGVHAGDECLSGLL
ncbi:hypothetical protein [Streptomyces sp. NPDC002589]